MRPDPEDPPAPEPEAALHQLRDGIARVRIIVREAQQAIGQAPPEGALLANAKGPPAPEGESGPVSPAA